MLKILHIKTTTLNKTAFIIAFFTFLSQILAVARDKILAIKFGASLDLDIYYAAFRIPDLVFLVTGTLVSSFILIPFFEKKIKNSLHSQREFTTRVFWSFMVFISVVSLVIFFLMPFLAKTFFTGFKGEALQTFITMSRIFLLSPIFMGLSRIFMGLNQTKDYFFPTVVTGVFYNLSIILSLIFFFPYFGFWALAFGVVLGSFLHLLLQVPSIFKEKNYPLKKIQFFSKKEIWEILSISVPRAGALIISELLLIFIIASSTNLATGSVTILLFALNIFKMPINLVAVSFSMASFPSLSRLFIEDKTEAFKQSIQKVVSQVLFFASPIAFFILFFSDAMVAFLLGSHKFAWPQIHTTALIASILSLVIVWQSISMLLVRFFYTMSKTWVALFVNLFILTIFLIVFKLLKVFVAPLSILDNIQDSGFFTQDVGGLIILVLAYVIAFSIGGVFAIFFFKKFSFIQRFKII